MEFDTSSSIYMIPVSAGASLGNTLLLVGSYIRWLPVLTTSILTQPPGPEAGNIKNRLLCINMV